MRSRAVGLTVGIAGAAPPRLAHNLQVLLAEWRGAAGGAAVRGGGCGADRGNGGRGVAFRAAQPGQHAGSGKQRGAQRAGVEGVAAADRPARCASAHPHSSHHSRAYLASRGLGEAAPLAAERTAAADSGAAGDAGGGAAGAAACAPALASIRLPLNGPNQTEGEAPRSGGEEGRGARQRAWQPGPVPPHRRNWAPGTGGDRPRAVWQALWVVWLRATTRHGCPPGSEGTCKQGWGNEQASREPLTLARLLCSATQHAAPLSSEPIGGPAPPAALHSAGDACRLQGGRLTGHQACHSCATASLCRAPPCCLQRTITPWHRVSGAMATHALPQQAGWAPATRPVQHPRSAAHTCEQSVLAQCCGAASPAQLASTARLGDWILSAACRRGRPRSCFAFRSLVGAGVALRVARVPAKK